MTEHIRTITPIRSNHFTKNKGDYTTMEKKNNTETLDIKLAELINEQLNSDETAALVKKKISNGIDEALSNLFSWNGKAKTIIQEKLESVMVPAIEKYNFDRYLLKLDAVLTDIVNTTRLQDNVDILENFKSLMVEIKDNKMSLEDIFRRYCKMVSKEVDTSELEVIADDDNPYYDSVNCSVEFEDGGTAWFSDRNLGKLLFKCDEDESLNFTLDLISSDSVTHNDNWRLCRVPGTTDIHSLAFSNEFKLLILQLMRNFTNINISKTYLSEEVEVEDTPEVTFI